MTPAEVLAAAADRLDALVAEATGGPWSAHYVSALHTDAGAWVGAPGERTTDGVYVASTANAVEGLGDAAYIAAMNPLVGKALSKVLRREAETLAQSARTPVFDGRTLMLPDEHLLEIARLIVGGETDG